MRNKLLGALAAIATVLAVPAVASAQEGGSTDYTSEVTSLATDGLGSVAPILLAVAGIAVGIAALRFGIRFVQGAVASGGKRTG